jgi:hypothetical protein
MRTFVTFLCLSILGAVSLMAAGPTTAVTFAKDVAPIIQRNCQNCHRPGEVAPMSFLSYKEVRPWAVSIREKVTKREMPPWFADPSLGEFSNDPRLSDKDIATLVSWAESGAKEGNPADMPPNPKFIPGWNVGQPDVVLAMTEDFAIPTEGVIPYKYFSIPTNFTEDRYVQLAEIRPGDRAHVHHVIVSVRYPQPGVEVPKAGEIIINPETRAALQRGRGLEDSDGRLVGWAPGEAPLILKPGEAKLVKAGSSLVFQVHYTTNGTPGKDRTSVGLIFSKVPVQKRVITAGAIGRNLTIPADEPNYESSGVFEFKEDSHIQNFHPHMHMRGKDMKFTLVYPDGTSKALLAVPHFNFSWQLTYFLKEPVAVPKGSKIEVVAHHDNSASNKANPDHTKVVHWGDQTWDEMMIGYFDYTLDKQDLRKAKVPEETGGTSERDQR